jgi:hypothetical protein
LIVDADRLGDDPGDGRVMGLDSEVGVHMVVTLRERITKRGVPALVSERLPAAGTKLTAMSPAGVWPSVGSKHGPLSGHHRSPDAA